MSEDLMPNITEKERADIQVATLYDLRLQISSKEQDTFTKEDVLKFIDTVASEKSQK